MFVIQKYPDDIIEMVEKPYGMYNILFPLCCMQFYRNIFIIILGSRYIFTFAIGAGPVTGLIIPELSSAQTRGKITGISFSVHWVCIMVLYAIFDGKGSAQHSDK